MYNLNSLIDLSSLENASLGNLIDIREMTPKMDLGVSYTNAVESTPIASKITPTTLGNFFPLGEDDFAGDATTTGVLTSDGTVTTGVINSQDDADWFAINVVSGLNYMVELASDTIDSEWHELSLRDSSGTLIASGDINDVLSFAATETGVLYIEASATNSTFSIGDYELTAISTGLADDYSDDVTTTGVLSTDGTVTAGVMDYEGDEDWFAMDVVAGETYVVMLTSDDLFTDSLMLTVHDSTGEMIPYGNIFYGSDNALTFTAAETGTFFIETADFWGEQTGHYQLTAIIPVDDYSADTATTGVLETDGTATIGTLDFQGDEDWFAIDVVAGEKYLVTLSTDDFEVLDFNLALHDGTGAFITNSGSSLTGNDIRLVFTAAETGTFFLETQNVFGDAGGDYQLTAITVEDDFSADVNTTGVLTTDGTTATGEIETADDDDWFAIQLTEGELYSISLTSDDISIISLNLDLLDSSGSLVAVGRFISGTETTLTYSATATATFYVNVDASVVSATGNYQLTANVFEDDFSADANTTGILATDGTGTSGAIEYVGDADWFAIQLTAGETYNITLTSDDISIYDLDIDLLNSAGSIVASDLSVNGIERTLNFTAAETGTFYVNVDSGPFVDTGNYQLRADVVEDDYASDVSTTGVLATDGTVTTGVIDYEYDTDWFAIDLVEGEFYSITLTSDNLPPYSLDLNLHDTAGDFITSGIAPFGHISALNFTAEETGTYFVDVSSGYFSNVGDYELTVNVIEDDFSADVNTTGVLTPDGAVTTGTIDYDEDDDWFAIELTEGELYSFTLTSDDLSAFFNLALNLHDRAGTFITSGVAYDYDGDINTLNFTAEETGTYFVDVSSDYFSSIGDYELTAHVIEDDYTADVSTAGVLTADGTVTTGMLEYIGDNDWFALEVTEGEIYNIVLTSDDIPSQDLSLRLIDSSGVHIAYGNIFAGTDATLTFTASETGTFYIDVGAYVYPDLGSYQITAELIEDDFSADVNTAGVLATDGTVTTGEIEIAEDDDWFAIQLTEGEFYSITLTSADISINTLDLKLLDSSGSFIASGDNLHGTETRLNFTATETATFYVNVDARHNSGTGDYQITANVVEDDYSEDVNTTGVLVADGTVTSGEIDIAGDDDWFAIELTEGEFYSITITSADISTYDLDLYLYNSSGAFVAYNSSSNGNERELTFTATETGTFYAEVDARFDSDTGNYQLTADIIEDDYSADVNTVGVLAADGTVTAGAIDYWGDDDWFAIQLTEGELYSITLTSDDISMSDFDLDLLNGAGSIVAYDRTVNGTERELTFTATETGTFYAQVDAWFDSGTGDYQLTANVIEDDFSADVNTTGVLATDGTVTTGAIDYAGDDDWFAMQLTEGEVYSITLTSDNISIYYDLDLDLLNSVGSIVAYDFAINETERTLVFTATETGTFYAQVDANYSSGTGGYQLTADIIEDDFSADVNTAGVLAADGTITSGAIEYTGDDDWFAIELTEGEIYSINLTSDDISIHDLNLALRNSAGQYVASDFNPNDTQRTLNFTATVTATFYVNVDSYFYSGTGDYQLTADIIEDDFTADVNTAGVLAVDGTVTTGEIEYAGDEDWFAIELIEGEFYSITLTSDDIFIYDFSLSVLDSSASYIAVGSNVNGTERTLNFTATETSIVYVNVDSNFNSDTGNYQLTADIIEDDFTADVNTTGVLATDGTVTTGEIEITDDADWFAIELTEGELYSIILTSDDISIYDFSLSLFDSSSTAVAYGNNSYGTESILTYTATESGTFFVNVDAYYFSATGNYQLTVISPQDVVLTENADSHTGTFGDDIISALGGNDTILGMAGDDDIDGGQGRDYLQGGDGDDFLFGGNGRDSDFLSGDGGADVLSGNNGSDWAYYLSSTSGLTVNLGNASLNTGDAAGDSYISIENLLGSEFADDLTGDSGNNFISGRRGDDVLNGGAGNDTLRGDQGADVLNGGDGTDWAHYGSSNAAVLINLTSGSANGGYAAGDSFSSIENILGSAFDDVLTGNADVNYLRAGDGADRLSGRDGSDFLEGQDGADILDGGEGSDWAYYITASSAVTVNLSDSSLNTGSAAAGDSYISIENALGSQFGDNITGTDGRNFLRGYFGDDVINGGGGDDVLIGDRGADELNGGDGADFAQYVNSLSGVTIDLEAGTAFGGDAQGDSFSSIENLFGSKHNDSLTGDNGENFLRGHTGDDIINGGAGNDTLQGGTGSDIFVFEVGTNSDVVVDFSDSDDLLDFTDFGVANALDNAAQVGDDVVFTFGDDVITIEDVTLADLADNLI